MRSIARTALLAAATIPLAVAAPALASAAEADSVSYEYAVVGSTVTNTITNGTTSVLGCTTSLVAVPDGELPPIEVVLGGDQSIAASGSIDPGVTTQTVTDVPDGSYVVLATCGSDGEDPGLWASDYEGLDEILALFPQPAFSVPEASRVVVVSAAAPQVPDVASVFGS